MKVLAYGDIIVDGKSAFTSVCTIDDRRLKIEFTGSIRVEAPSRRLEGYVRELQTILPDTDYATAEFDFRGLRFCNSNGFYLVMDITGLVVEGSDCPIVIHRLADDDWHQETLPILINTEEPEIAGRVSFVEHESM